MDKSSDDNTDSRRVADSRVEQEDNDRDPYDWHHSSGSSYVEPDNSGSFIGALFDILFSPAIKDRDSLSNQRTTTLVDSGYVLKTDSDRYFDKNVFFVGNGRPTVDTSALPEAFKPLPRLYVPLHVKNLNLQIQDDSGQTYSCRLSIDSGNVDDSAIGHTHNGSSWKSGWKAEKPHSALTFWGLRAMSGLKYSSHYANASAMGIVYANHYAWKRRISLSLDIGIIPTDERSDLFGSIKDITTIQLAFDHRWYSTPDYTWMGLFLHAGLELKALVWDFTNPVYSDLYDDNGTFIKTDKISGDAVSGLSLPFGPGWTMLQTRYARVSVEGSAVLSVYWNETFAGFSNDVFGPDAEFRLTVEAIFGMPR